MTTDPIVTGYAAALGVPLGTAWWPPDELHAASQSADKIRINGNM
jgi:hypothetical protein